MIDSQGKKCTAGVCVCVIFFSHSFQVLSQIYFTVEVRKLGYLGGCQAIVNLQGKERMVRSVYSVWCVFACVCVRARVCVCMLLGVCFLAY